jgi:hypothetical protein
MNTNHDLDGTTNHDNEHPAENNPIEAPEAPEPELPSPDDETMWTFDDTTAALDGDVSAGLTDTSPAYDDEAYGVEFTPPIDAEQDDRPSESVENPTNGDGVPTPPLIIAVYCCNVNNHLVPVERIIAKNAAGEPLCPEHPHIVLVLMPAEDTAAESKEEK